MRKPKTTAGRVIAAEIEREANEARWARKAAEGEAAIAAEDLTNAKAAAAAWAAEARRLRAYADAKAKTRAWYDPAAEGAAAASKEADDLAIALAALRQIAELPASRAKGVAGKALRKLGQPVPAEGARNATLAERDAAAVERFYDQPVGAAEPVSTPAYENGKLTGHWCFTVLNGKRRKVFIPAS